MKKKVVKKNPTGGGKFTLMTSKITKFERYLCFLTLEKKLYEVDKFIEGFLTDKHPRKM